MERAHIALIGAFLLIAAPSFSAQITDVTPDLVLASSRLGIGGTSIAIRGSGFAADDVAKVGGLDLLSPVITGTNLIRGRVPALTPGFYAVQVYTSRGILKASLDRAVEVTNPVTLVSVTPRTISRFGGTQVTVAGTNFRSATVIKFGTHSLQSPTVNTGGTAIVGLAPALGAGEADGPYDATAEDSRGKVTLAAGVIYQTPFELHSVEPFLVSTLGGTSVTFIGTGFKAGSTLKLGGLNLTGVAFVDSQHMTGLSPALAAGFKDAEIILPAGAAVVSRRLIDAVEAAPPPSVRLVTPVDVSGEASTRVVVTGANFRAETQVFFGSHELLETALGGPDTINGRAPPLAAGEPLGLKNVTVQDSRGSDTLKNGVNYVAPPSITLRSVSPFLISTLGGQEVTFDGLGFQSGDTLDLGGSRLTGVTFVNATRMRGITPALAAGFHPAAVNRPGGGTATLARAVEAAPPPVLRTITPNRVSTAGGTMVTIAGANFREVTVFKLGALELQSPVVATDGSSVDGVAPAQPPGVKDVTAEDSRGRSTLANGVTYAAPDLPSIPGPQVTETALAYRKARFDWENLFDYDQIQVLDENDAVVATLPGNSTRYETDAGNAKKVTRKFKGVSTSYGLTKASTGLALIHQCVVPPPLIGLAPPGELEFTLFGGHFQNNDDACEDGSAGGGANLEFAYPMNGMAHMQGSNSTGYVVAGNADLSISPVFTFIDRNKLTTGFTLPSDADKLEIRGFYKKIGVAAGLELRFRLIHVFPEDGFSAEFEFPETLTKEDKEWHSAIYFRSFLDDQGVRQPCLGQDGKLKKIPAGEYLLDLYAVGGNPKLPYFQFADDSLDLELFIKGSPCPPYPMVQVTDLTGVRSVPQVQCIKHEIEFYPGNLFPLTVDFHAQGTWIDFDNTVYRIHGDQGLCTPEGPSVNAPHNNSPDFEYNWAIFQDEETPISKTSGNSPTLWYHPLPDWGCYKIELTIRDKKCGLESKFSTEIAIYPENIACNSTNLNSSTCTSPQKQMKEAFLFPTPNPKNIYAVVGLKPEPGNGQFEGERPVDFRVLIVPCYCGTGPNDYKTCPAVNLGDDPDDPNDDQIEFRLAIKQGSNYIPLPNPKIIVTDECKDVVLGPKYLHVTIKDLGEIPYTAALGQFTFKSVYFQARSRYALEADGFTHKAGDPAGCWRNVGSPLKLSNPPDSLGTSYWNGHFEPGDTSYHFISKSSQDTEHNFDLGASKEMPIDIPDVDAGVPSFENNNVTTGFTSRFMALRGKWSDEDATGGMSGNTLGNDLKGEPLQVKGAEKFISGGGDIDYPYYEWCKQVDIFKNKFSTTLFEAIIYTGTIGPVPVTVWASVGLGMDFLIQAYAFVKVSPFAPINGGNYLDAYFDLKSQIAISIPCEVRADILGGLASIAMRLRPEATFELIPYLIAENINLNVDFYMAAFFSLYFEIEACIQTIIFGEQCFGTGEVALIDHEEIFSAGGPKPNRPGDCDTGDGGEVQPGRGQGGQDITVSAYQLAVAPATVISPDRKSVLDIWVKETNGNLLQARVNEVPIKAVALPGASFYLIDPTAAFVSNTAALMVWTQPAFPIDTDDTPPKTDPAYLDVVNQNAAGAEIKVSALIKHPGTPSPFDWELFDLTPHSIDAEDVIGDVPQVDWRADGRASISADLSSAEALVTWVRYDTPDFMVQDGTVVATVACAQNEQCFCGIKPCRFKKVTLPNFRPQMEMTAIFVRRFGFRTEIVPMAGEMAWAEHRSQSFKVSPPGINIEPNISVSPSGNKAYCVWLNDSTPGHKDLINSNLGRQILYSVYTKNPADLDDPNQWSAPAGALLVPNNFPALLEPRIMLSGDDKGLLVFTAITKNSPQRDSGLGGNRYLYASRLEGGIFGLPFKVHGKCLKREYGYSQSIHIHIPDLVDPLDKIHYKKPEWVMVYQGLGELGSREASGNVMATSLPEGGETWSPPVNLTPDGNMHSNVTAAMGDTGIHSIHLDGGPAAFIPGGGGFGGGIGDNKTFVVKNDPLLPDPAISGCRIDFPCASPGSIVKVTVEVENLGLMGTPLNNSDNTSALGLNLILIADDGRRLLANTGIFDDIMPGETTRLTLDVEMPMEPARLRAELVPGPFDANLDNNVKDCFLGAPAPTDFTCQAIPFTLTGREDEEVDGLAVKLKWSNPVPYDEVILYRDELQIASLPGNAKMWIDSATNSGTHSYAVRGRISVSRSVKTACVLPVVPPSREGFIRGDADSNRVLEITDPIAILSYMFTAGATPRCLDAADADDNGLIEITDAIRVLGYMFLGGPEPAAPGPKNCGPDPTTDDRLAACGTVCQ